MYVFKINNSFLKKYKQKIDKLTNENLQMKYSGHSIAQNDKDENIIYRKIELLFNS